MYVQYSQAVARATFGRYGRSFLFVRFHLIVYSAQAAGMKRHSREFRELPKPTGPRVNLLSWTNSGRKETSNQRGRG